MAIRLLLSLVLAVALLLGAAGLALAHGEPVIAVEPAVVAAGGQITVTGSEMEPGEMFAISLEGLAGAIALGEATVTEEGEAGGFTATYTIPADTVPGSYVVSAAAEDGDTTVADLTVTAPSEQASAGPAMVREATGEPHDLERPRSTVQVATVVAAIALSSVAGLMLVRGRG